MKPEPKCPDYRIVFTAQAKAVMRVLGWTPDYIRERARHALRSTHPEDYGFCEFNVPLREVAFKSRLIDQETAEIDLYDWGQENLAAR